MNCERIEITGCEQEPHEHRWIGDTCSECGVAYHIWIERELKRQKQRAEKAESALKEQRTEWVGVARLEAAVDILNRIASHKIDTTDCADVTGSEEPIECVAEWVAERMIDFQNAQDKAEAALQEEKTRRQETVAMCEQLKEQKKVLVEALQKCATYIAGPYRYQEIAIEALAAVEGKP